MYVWTSSNTSVATVSTKGIVMTTSAIGHTQVRAADMKNLANFGTSEVGGIKFFIESRVMTSSCVYLHYLMFSSQTH